MKPFWTQINEPTLAQGDLLPDCPIPFFEPRFGEEDTRAEVSVAVSDMIIVTQSCDLAQNKVILVALCPIHSLATFEEANPEFKSKRKWENVRKGRIAGLHLLASPTEPEKSWDALVVDFGQIFSLPFGYLIRRAEKVEDRWRLESPFLEHFSQAFARFFMRVGLPSSIPAFT